MNTYNKDFEKLLTALKILLILHVKNLNNYKIEIPYDIENTKLIQLQIINDFIKKYNITNGNQHINYNASIYVTNKTIRYSYYSVNNPIVRKNKNEIIFKNGKSVVNKTFNLCNLSNVTFLDLFCYFKILPVIENLIISGNTDIHYKNQYDNKSIYYFYIPQNNFYDYSDDDIKKIRDMLSGQYCNDYYQKIYEENKFKKEFVLKIPNLEHYIMNADINILKIMFSIYSKKENILQYCSEKQKFILKKWQNNFNTILKNINSNSVDDINYLNNEIDTIISDVENRLLSKITNINLNPIINSTIKHNL